VWSAVDHEEYEHAAVLKERRPDYSEKERGSRLIWGEDRVRYIENARVINVHDLDTVRVLVTVTDLVFAGDHLMTGAYRFGEEEAEAAKCYGTQSGEGASVILNACCGWSVASVAASHTAHVMKGIRNGSRRDADDDGASRQKRQGALDPCGFDPGADCDCREE
jgi:hypothetical protein